MQAVVFLILTSSPLLLFVQAIPTVTTPQSSFYDNGRDLLNHYIGWQLYPSYNNYFSSLYDQSQIDTSASDPSESDPSESDPSESDPSESDPSESDPSVSDQPIPVKIKHHQKKHDFENIDGDDLVYSISGNN